MSNDNNGPVFPSLMCSQNNSTGEITNYQSEAGMTLRDYFAAKALMSLVSMPLNDERAAAIIAYRIADAMLAAREAK